MLRSANSKPEASLNAYHWMPLAVSDERTRQDRAITHPCFSVMNSVILAVILLIEVNSVIVFYKVYAGAKASGLRTSLMFIMVTASGVFLLTKLIEWLAYVDSNHRLSLKALNCSMALLVWSSLGSTTCIVLFNKEEIIFDIMIEIFVVLSFALTALLLVKVNSQEQQHQQDDTNYWGTRSSPRGTPSPKGNREESMSIFHEQWI